MHSLALAVWFVILSIVGVERAGSSQPLALPEYAEFGTVYPGLDATCGIDCLYVAARLLGQKADLNEIAEAAGLTREGTSMKGLKDAAQAIGLNAVGVEVTDKSVDQIKPPAILHLTSKHFILY